MAAQSQNNDSVSQMPLRPGPDSKARANTDPLRSWGDASLRTWRAHQDGRSAVDVLDAELSKGSALHSLVDLDQVRTVIQLYRRSLERVIRDVRARASHGDPQIEPIQVLFAPTARVIDYNVRADAIQNCIRKLYDSGQEAALLSAIEHGPGHGREMWDNPSPQTPVELVASIVRWAALGHGEKKRIRVSDSLRSWMLDAAQASGAAEINPRLGGVSAVGALTSNSLGHTASMMSLGSIPRDVAARLPQSIKIVGDSADTQTIGDLAIDPNAVGNFGILIPSHSWSLPQLLPNATINGRSLASYHIPTLDCLITGSSSVPGFGTLSSERMQRLGGTHDLMILTGFQSLHSKESVDAYFDNITDARSGHIPIALLYSETKHPDIEPYALLRLKESREIDFLGMNAVEAFDLLQRIHANSIDQNLLLLSPELRARLQKFTAQEDLEHPAWRNTKEIPKNVLEGAKLLQEILDIPLIRVRGRFVDVLIGAKNFELGSSEETPDRPRSFLKDVIFNLASSRLLGVIKASLSGGLIKESTDITQLFNLPEGSKLAALRLLDDAIARDRTTSQRTLTIDRASSSHALLAEDFVSLLPDGRMVAAIPPMELHDKTGGTVSAGDVMDSSFLVESIELLRRAYDYNSRPTSFRGGAPDANVRRLLSPSSGHAAA